jgi:hypothetical protein
MDIRKGDKVKFLNESGGGIVVRIIDSKQALVQIDDGFEIPVLITQLVKTESSGERAFEAAKQDFKLKPGEVKQKAEKPVFATVPTQLASKEIIKPLFAIAHVSEKLDADNARFELFLLNDGEYFIYYIVALEKLERLQLLEKGDLEPEMKVSLGTFQFNEILALDAVVFDIFFYDEREYRAQQPVHYRLNLKSLNLLRNENYKDNEYFYEQALVLNLLKTGKDDTELKKSTLKKDENKAPIKKADTKEPEIEVVDLHIEEIVDNNPGSLSNGEIINIQMARFTTAMEGAIIGKTKKIVFIHGVGNGKLRYEVRKTLDSKYSQYQYQDASFAEYGFGATMVMLNK